MNRIIIGGVLALASVTGGLIFWQGWAAREVTIPAPPPPQLEEDEVLEAEGLPEAGKNAPRYGAAPPLPPEAAKASREEARFNRYDRNRDNIITRVEMMSSRTKAFKKLDKDGNNLLSFEEWGEATSERFAKADGNRDKQLTRPEFAATKPKASKKASCKC
jgi:hypothetical protein